VTIGVAALVTSTAAIGWINWATMRSVTDAERLDDGLEPPERRPARFQRTMDGTTCRK
jgi:hypothetical protein